MTLTERIASWVEALSFDEIPSRVLDIAKSQYLSVLGAIYASASSAGGRSVMEAVDRWDGEGNCSVFPGAKGHTLLPALLQNCALSMALDYDDYLFMGHTGHSAVLVPLALAEMTGVDSRRMLAATVIGNEVAGRLGASVVLGPHNGQMWAHIHLLGAAAAAAKVLDLDAEETANAMGIAMAEPVYPLFPAFMGPQSKMLTAATPAITGAVAALLAGEGTTGPRGILEDPQGFWSNFSFLPLPFMMTGLGRAWVTDTVAFKPYPGCAYVDTTLDALFSLMREHEHSRGRGMEPGEVRRVEVEASLLTVAMDTMSREYLDPRRLSPSGVNFSIPISVAVGLLAGMLCGQQLAEGYLEQNGAKILSVARKVELKHDASYTVRFLRAMDEVLDLRAMLGSLDFRKLFKARRRLREHLSSVGTMGVVEALGAWKSLDREERSFIKGLVNLSALLSQGRSYDLGSGGFEELEMPFGARVSIELEDGSFMQAEKLVPRGAPGDPDRLRVPLEKFSGEVGAFLGEKATADAVRFIESLEEKGIEELSAVLSSPARTGYES